MPHDHQHLELRLVAKQQHGGCGDRIDWLLQCHHKLQFSVGLILDAGPFKLSNDLIAICAEEPTRQEPLQHLQAPRIDSQADRTSGVEGKSVSVRVERGGRSIIKKKRQYKKEEEHDYRSNKK